MTVEKLLVANRGEIAVRIMATAADLGIATVAIHPADDAEGLHVATASQRVVVPGEGPAAYLDVDAVVAAAVETGADAVHPGYGFLAERADLARACDAADVAFVGPAPATLELFGDKGAARRHARSCGVPVLRGTDGPTSLDEAQELLADLGPDAAVMVKAVAGGGGRGMRPAAGADELAQAFERCASEAEAAFGSGDVYVEELLATPRHLEVQVAGDGRGLVLVLGDRDCSVQRRRQKLLEIAPAPALTASVRAALHDHARSLAAAASYRSLGTMEFLVSGERIAFIEGNARIQVEHTVTEEVTGIDLVALQLSIAGGAVDLATVPIEERGVAVQARVNAETIDRDGSVRPSDGRLDPVVLPTGPGIRVDSSAVAGAAVNARYDSLMAKVVAWAPGDDHGVALRRLGRALGEVELGVSTTAPLLAAVAAQPEVAAGTTHTTWLDTVLPQLVADEDAASPVAAGPADAVVAPLQGTVVAIDVAIGQEVAAGEQLMVMEAMKMEHVIVAPHAGIVVGIEATIGAAIAAGATLVTVHPAEVARASGATTGPIDLDHVRDDLAEVVERHAIGLDERRPEAVAKRRRTDQRTARENLDDLLDPGSYIEYGPLVIAPQRKRRSVEDLIANTPADGMIAGIGSVNGSRCVVMSYDYTVLAGTQGGQNHRKKDRLFELAHRLRLPVVFFTEGGGGRPGDTDGMNVAGLDCLAFGLWGELSGLVPLVGINSGYCFAGNAAILGCCDVIIATENSNIGMGGPAMIEGGGLGVYHPTEVGPMEVQRPNGVVDITVADEAEAVAVAKQYLSYFQGPTADWECVDQRTLRHLIPEHRLRIYDIRTVVDAIFDAGSVLELRPDFGHGMITALARIEGRPVGVIANNPAHLAGAIDSPAADKAARFMQLCDAFDLPIVSLCDTPGFMVGPEHEKTALVRHVSRMFVTARSVTVPTCTIVLRKGYGLGAQAMASGGFKFPLFTVGWPTSEFGGMGLEGAVKLGYRKELDAVEDADERQALYEELVARMYRVGKGVSMADHFEIDDVIDPADSRHWITTAFDAAPPPVPRTGKKRPMIDTW